MNNMYEVLYSWTDPKYGHDMFPEHLGNRRKSYLYASDQLHVRELRYGSPLQLVYGLTGDELIAGAAVVTAVAVAVKACFSAISSAFEAARGGVSFIAACREEFLNLRQIFRGDDNGDGGAGPQTFALKRSASSDLVQVVSVVMPERPGLGDSSPRQNDWGPTFYKDADVEQLLHLVMRECRRISDICGYPRFEM